MANIRDLRQRIRSVSSIKQITRAMEMVATTKLRKYQDRALASRPYTQEIQKLVASLGAAAASGQLNFASPLFAQKEGRTAIFLVSSDRGLCGAYNTNIIHMMEEFIESSPKEKFVFYVYGRKGYQYLSKRGYEVENFFVEPPLEKISLRAARVVVEELVGDFQEGKFAQLQVFYTAFRSMIAFKPTREKLLPIEAGELAKGQGELSSDIIFEPNAQTIFDQLVPKFLESKLFHVLMESLTSEFAARRMSMKNATDAASEMRGELSRLFNRARQEGITKQLLEIVGGAEALK